MMIQMHEMQTQMMIVEYWSTSCVAEATLGWDGVKELAFSRPLYVVLTNCAIQLSQGRYA